MRRNIVLFSCNVTVACHICVQPTVDYIGFIRTVGVVWFLAVLNIAISVAVSVSPFSLVAVLTIDRRLGGTYFYVQPQFCVVQQNDTAGKRLRCHGRSADPRISLFPLFIRLLTECTRHKLRQSRQHCGQQQCDCSRHKSRRPDVPSVNKIRTVAFDSSQLLLSVIVTINQRNIISITHTLRFCLPLYFSINNRILQTSTKSQLQVSFP